jgi:hypothetical protein
MVETTGRGDEVVAAIRGGKARRSVREFRVAAAADDAAVRLGPDNIQK